MEKPTDHFIKKLLEQLENCSGRERGRLLAGQSDQVLWRLFRQGCRRALVVLFRRHHRRIIVQVYQKNRMGGSLRLADVQDVFGEFVERILAGKFDGTELKKDFPSFAVHHLSFLLKDKAKTVERRARLRAAYGGLSVENDDVHSRVQEELDLGQIINLIPKIGNRVYRMVLYLIFIRDYNSKDLTAVLGKSALASDKKYRAMAAFRDLLKREGIWDELC